MGYIGVEDTMELVLKVMKQYPDIQCYPYPHASFEEISGIMERYEPEVDMWLFSGPLPYETAKRESRTKLPMFYIPFAGEGLYRTLFLIGRERRIQLDRLSFDVFSEKELAAVFQELDAANLTGAVASKRGSDEELTRFHYQMWQEGRTDAAVTCVWLVHQRLQKLGVPVYRVTPTASSVATILEKALRSQELKRVQDMQIAVQLFEADCAAAEAANDDGKRAEPGMIRLAEYAKGIQGSLQRASGSRTVLFSTRGRLSEATSGFTAVPAWAGQLDDEMPFTSGIGIGRTAYEAETLAEQALARAKRSGPGSWMVCLQDKTVIGPLGGSMSLVYEYVSEQARQASGQTVLSAATIGKLDAVLKRLGTNEINAYELAEHMQIKPRSARRILAELEASGIAVIAGEENPHPRGRPRKRYRIDWNKGKS